MKGNSLRVITPFLRRHRTRILLSIAGMALFTGLSLMPPLIMRYLVDEVATGGAWVLLPAVVLARTLIPIMAHAIRFFNVQLIMLSATRIIADIRTATYRKALRSSMAFHQAFPSGMLVCRIMDDVNMVQRLLTGETVRTVVDVIVVVFSLAIMFMISVPLALGTLVIVALYILSYRIFSRRIRSSTQAFRGMFDQVATRLNETLNGVRQVRIYNREEWENSLFLDRTSSSMSYSLESSMAAVNLDTACGAISGFGSTILISVGAAHVLQETLSFGDLTAFNSYLWMMITPVVRLMTMAGNLTQTMVSVERVAEVLGREDDISSPASPEALAGGDRTVEFRNVTFSYEPDTPLYRDLSLTVAPGMTVALVGPTGCGKSTLLSLLMRLWDVQKGAVLIGGLDIRDIGLHELRDLFGVVLQKPVVFEGTLADNIAYGDPTASRERIEAAAKAAEIYDMAMAFPDGFDTWIGTQGVTLSLGEKQRVSIARAILRDPDILIMDEATSSLDSHSEALIQKALSRLLSDRTSFVVAHRLSTITQADLIVVMDSGRIVESGRHAELLRAGGLYRRLYDELMGTRHGEGDG